MEEGSSAVDLSKVETVKPAEFAPANNNKRVIAFILDGVFTAALKAFLFQIFRIENSETAYMPDIVFWLLTSFFYWSVITHFYGGSPGKLVLGLKVVGVDQKPRVGIGRLFFRETIGRILSMLPIMLGYVWVSWDSERRTFHDMVAKTRVVEFKK